MAVSFHKTDSSDIHFAELVTSLDGELAVYNGTADIFYSQFNKITLIKNVIVLYENLIPVACGAFKVYDDQTIEIKRMYVKPAYRRLGYAAHVLKALEAWANEEGYKFALLETGKFLPGTIELYSKSGYHIIPNYDQYIGIEASVCMKKSL